MSKVGNVAELVDGDKRTSRLVEQLMATFFVLPPRPLVGDAFAAFLNQFFPGLEWDADMRWNMAQALGDATASRPDGYVVYRDDLPIGEPTGEVLQEAFGAETGDEIVELRFSGRPCELTSRRWRLRRNAA
jgi:hypothetical protein